jgi:cyclophilin family peptidyl-prolyl cis-trans isomerase
MKEARTAMKRITLNLGMAVLGAALLAACGGGGGDAGGPPPTVSGGTVTNQPRYAEQLQFTLQGTNLDQALNFQSSGCRNFTRLSGSATVASYGCTVSGVGAQTIAVSTNATPGTLLTLNFTIVRPEVTLFISSGSTALGQIVVSLRPDLTPLTVDNFLAYVKSGFYDNTVFHRNGRVANGGPFVLQGGGYTAPVRSTAPLPAPKATSAPIRLERGLSNLRYTVAMARTSALDSATSEFFINVVDNAFLDTAGGGYAAFGTIVQGTAVVDAMDSAPCTAGYFGVGNPDCLPEPNLIISLAQQTR